MDISTNNIASSSVKGQAQTKQGPQADFLFLAWYLVLQGVNIQQQTLQVEANDLHSNGTAQDNLNDEINALQLQAIPPLVQKHKNEHGVEVTENVNSTEVAVVQSANQQITKMQTDDENVVILLRQKFETKSTMMNTEASQMLQQVSEGSKMATVLKQIALIITNKKNLG